MTKKDFIGLADAICEHNRQAERDNRFYQPFDENQLETLAQFCEAQNQRFNRPLWLDYIAGKCGKNGGKL